VPGWRRDQLDRWTLCRVRSWASTLSDRRRAAGRRRGRPSAGRLRDRGASGLAEGRAALAGLECAGRRRRAAEPGHGLARVGAARFIRLGRRVERTLARATPTGVLAAWLPVSTGGDDRRRHGAGGGGERTGSMGIADPTPACGVDRRRRRARDAGAPR